MNPQQLGIIDMGSNSIRFVVYEINELGCIKEIQNLKVVARLSSHINENGEMTKQGITAIFETLDRFKDVASKYDLREVRGVATAAIRNATNQQEIMQQIKENSDFPIEVLSDQGEAYYGFLAVTNSMNVQEGITIDIGGGSTEVTLFENREMLDFHSIPFGAITLKKQFIKSDQPTKTEIDTLISFLQEEFSKLSWLKDKKYPVIGIGGSARNLALIHQQKNDYPLSGLHHYEMQYVDIRGINQELQRLQQDERRKVDGLSKDRVDIIIPAITAIEELVRFTGSEQLIISDKGLRNGLLYEMYLHPMGMTHFPNVAEESTYQLSHDYALDFEHQKRISVLSAYIHHEIKSILPTLLTNDDLKLMKLAARIFYIGEAIHTESISQHTFYLLTNKTIEGVTHRERLIISLLASFKSRSQLKQYLKPYQDWFSEKERRKYEIMGAVLKLCYGLDRSYRSIIKEIHISVKNEMWEFQIGYTEDPYFEEFYSNKYKKHLEKAVEKEIELKFYPLN
ncbi:exopolyphosphatase [Bacillus alkalicola]|uniref:Exopolyphosphatase n=2 Tax=Bacillales TaxID=1385 RepID=A0ABS6JVQ1_9BACI|nr:exopolyphosphatase [Bacillus alkalicola]